MQFKVGDRVKYVSGNFGDGPSNPLWNGKYGRILGTVVYITNITTGLPYKVEWDNNTYNGYNEHDLEKNDYGIKIVLEEELFTI